MSDTTEQVPMRTTPAVVPFDGSGDLEFLVEDYLNDLGEEEPDDDELDESYGGPIFRGPEGETK